LAKKWRGSSAKTSSAQVDVAMDAVFLDEGADRIAPPGAGRPRLGFGRRASFHGR
jgi:hypothetical protein